MMVEACHNLACSRHGADDAYLRLHTKTHQAMKYYVHHKFGVSSEYNTFSTHPWHGAGQGAADTAPRYIALSDTLIDAYHTKVIPTMMADPLQTIQLHHSLKAFIDDVVLHASPNPQTTYKTLLQQAQAQLRWWNQLVQVTGGSLKHKKCCAITYQWTPDRYGILILSQPDDIGTITLTDDLNLQPITNLLYTTEHVTWGCISQATAALNQWNNTFGKRHLHTLQLFNVRQCHAGKQVCYTGLAIYRR